MPIELSVVDILCRCIKAGSTAHDPIPSLTLPFLPFIDQAIVYPCIKGNDRESGELSQGTKLREEASEHRIGDRPRLVDGYSYLRSPIDPLSSMNIGEPLIDTTNRRTLAATLTGLDKVSKNLLPAHLWCNHIHDLLSCVC